jgi:hypothetical protein
MKNRKNVLDWSSYFITKYWVLLLFVILKLVIQFLFVNPIYELHRDEFLHLDQAFHTSAGYISVPPFTSWVSKIVYLFGGSLFWIRFFPALFGSFTIVFAWHIVVETGGKLYAQILTAVFLIFSVFARMNVLFQPNSFDILAWTALFFLLIKYIKTKQDKWLILFSIVAALGLYNKYTIIFLIVGFIASLLVSEQRTIFRKKAFYITIALCLFLFAPNIIWQINNHFPVIRHMEALSRSQLVNINRVDFLFEQIKFGLIGIAAIASFWALAFYKPFKPYRFIGWSYVVVMLLFTICRAKSYYAFGLYPVLFAVGSVYLEVVLKRWNKVAVPLLVVTTIAIFFTIVRFSMPIQSPSVIVANRTTYERIGLLRWEDGQNHCLPQDFADMIGWKEMADKSLKAYKMIPENEVVSTLIFCDNYGQTGALNYYNRGEMHEAYACNTDYIYWLPHFKKIENVILVGKQPSKEIIDMFKDFKVIGTVENEFSREKDTKIFLLLKAKSNFTEWFYTMVEERKRKYDIF